MIRLIHIITTLAFSLALSACAGTELEVNDSHPGNAKAQAVAPPTPAAAFAPDFDPLASAAEDSDGAATKTEHDHASMGHDPASTEHDPAADEPKPGGEKYTCPMHPEVIREKPGNCPICGMKLVPMKPKQQGE